MIGELAVLGVGVWTAAAPNLAAFLAGQRTDADSSKPRAQLLSPRMRGRASLLTAMFADVVEQATQAAAVEPRTLPCIFGSAYGEMGTTLTLIDQLYAGDGQLSPAKFQASVHNTAAGQLSIALGNPLFSTSIAAGYDTLAMTLLEAGAWLSAHPGQVVIACADEGASTALQPDAAYPPLAAAFVLSNQSEAQPLARLSALQISDHASLPNTSHNPCAPALALARAVFSAQQVTLGLNEGAPGGYSVSVDSLGAYR